MEDLYAILGVQKSASGAEIKSAFRKKAMQFHPDRNPGDTEAEKKFKEINAAYEILKDDDKRAAYDKYGPAAFQQGGAGGFGRGGFAQGGFPGGGFEFSGSFEDLFEDILGGVFGQNMGGTGPHARRSRQQHGVDLRYNLEISLAEAATGMETDITFPCAQTCSTCKGSGAKAGTQPKPCGTCGGSGAVQFRQGFFSMSRTCPECGGSGEIIPEKCPDCKGSGRTVKQKTLKVNVPAGVDTGTRLRLAGEGEAGTHGGPAGDLFVFITVAPHPLYRREGTTLHADVPLSLMDAVMGTELELPSLEGKKIKVKVPAGTQPGSTQHVAGEGMPQLGRAARRGDMVLHYNVSIPTKLTKQQQDLFTQLADSGLARSGREESFLTRLKELFR